MLRFIIILFILFILVVILPNIMNRDERLHFSNEIRMENAMNQYHEGALLDSITITPGSYYADRSDFHHYWFGKNNRDLWKTPVSVPVFHLSDSLHTYTCQDIGGGDQTINIELSDDEGKIWTLRSIDKDQSHALPEFLRYTILRFIVRDAVVAMNPFGAIVADNFAEAADLLHTNPRIVFIPYIENMNPECRLRMAGRLALLEEEADKNGWAKTESFDNAETILNSDDMLNDVSVNGRSIDTLQYLRARLLDILISDWDRHEGQWVWVLNNNVYSPVPIDRDMAFYNFDGGVINRFMLFFNNKFRSFHSDYSDISGFIYNSRYLDDMILGSVPEEIFIKEAGKLQVDITNEEIETAFREYPQPIYDKIGKKHIEILKQRKDKLKKAAKGFFAALHD